MKLVVHNVDAFYGAVQVLRGFYLDLAPGEVLCLFGRNGAGKTTALKTIMGLVKRTGQIHLGGHDLINLSPHQIPRRGIGYVPQGRRLFAEMTVLENLTIGLMTRDKSMATRDRVLDMFPPLKPRLGQLSGTLSGGEQQMLAMARALCLEPEVLLLDEPTEGLMPAMIATIRDVVAQLRDLGVAVLLVEQRVEAVLSVADRIAFIENGSTQGIIDTDTLQQQPELLRKYGGVSYDT